MLPLLTRNIKQGEEVGMRHEKMRVHVAEPGVDAGEVCHFLVHYVFVLFLDEGGAFADLFGRVHAYAFLPLILTAVQSLLQLNNLQRLLLRQNLLIILFLTPPMLCLPHLLHFLFKRISYVIL